MAAAIKPEQDAVDAILRVIWAANGCLVAVVASALQAARSAED